MQTYADVCGRMQVLGALTTVTVSIAASEAIAAPSELRIQGILGSAAEALLVEEGQSSSSSRYEP
jgi:hypothetical protein